MKRKLVWLFLSCLMVVALILASCTPAVTEGEEEEMAPPSGIAFMSDRDGNLEI